MTIKVCGVLYSTQWNCSTILTFEKKCYLIKASISLACDTLATCRKKSFYDLKATLQHFYIAVSLDKLCSRHTCHNINGTRTSVMRHLREYRILLSRIVWIAETKLRCVCEAFATGSRRMRWLGDCFAKNFVSLSLWKCSKLSRAVSDQFAMHSRTLRFHANVSQQFATVWRIN